MCFNSPLSCLMLRPKINLRLLRILLVFHYMVITAPVFIYHL